MLDDLYQSCVFPDGLLHTYIQSRIQTHGAHAYLHTRTLYALQVTQSQPTQEGHQIFTVQAKQARSIAATEPEGPLRASQGVNEADNAADNEELLPMELLAPVTACSAYLNLARLKSCHGGVDASGSSGWDTHRTLGAASQDSCGDFFPWDSPRYPCGTPTCQATAHDVMPEQTMAGECTLIQDGAGHGDENVVIVVAEVPHASAPDASAVEGEGEAVWAHVPVVACTPPLQKPSKVAQRQKKGKGKKSTKNHQKKSRGNKK